LKALLFAVALSFLAGGDGTAPIQLPELGDQKQVLVLYSVRRDAQLVSVAERILNRTLSEGLDEPIDYYSEFIDLGRFDQPDYVAALRDFMRAKYKARTFDVVIAIGEEPMDFVQKYRTDELFRGPVVFFTTRPFHSRPDNSTGVIAETQHRDTIALAGELQPDLRNVYVVSGSSPSELAFERAARQQLSSMGSRFSFTYLSGLPTSVLEARLTSLPPHSIVYFLLVLRDPAGKVFLPLEYLDRITPLANAPVYTWVDSAMGHGIVGGSLKSQAMQMAVLAALALRVLRGQPAADIPPAVLNLHVRQVDWRQLRRWGISETRVPAGTRILFREPSAWERYKKYIVGTAVLLLAQSLLISGLLVERTRRRAAEQQAVASRTALGRSHDRIRDLGARLLNAQEGERSRIARDLHDDISQQIALLIIDLEQLKTATQRQAESLAQEALSRAHLLAGGVHDLSHRLHPAKLQLLGLIPALQALQREMSRSGIPVGFTYDKVLPALAPDLALCLFRIVQEGLQNAVKYSKASGVSVHLHGEEHGITLTIVDDGVGFGVNAAWGRGLGLISMQERLEALGGTLRIRSEPGAGTRLEASLPVPVAEGAPEWMSV
jgi:signal transduction histidine kinase